MSRSPRLKPSAEAKRPSRDVAPALLRVMILDDDVERSRNLRGALSLAGYHVVSEVRDSINLPDAVLGLKPDIIVAAADSPDRDTLEHISLTTRSAPRPVVMFTQDGASDSIKAAVKAGVSAYIVDGLAPERLKPILEVACARFEAHQAMADELAETQRELADRKLVEKAKGLLMQRRGLTEDQAYKELRNVAMQTGKKLAEVADQLVMASQLI